MMIFTSQSLKSTRTYIACYILSIVQTETSKHFNVKKPPKATEMRLALLSKGVEFGSDAVTLMTTSDYDNHIKYE